MKSKVCRNDIVQVLAGRDKGKRGKVLRVYAKAEMVLVEGINFRKKALRRSQDRPQGGLIDIERPIHLSNVAVVDPKTDKPTRIGRKEIKDRGKLRVSKKSGEVLEVKS